MSSPCHKCPHGIAGKDGVIFKEHIGKNYEDLACSSCELIHNESVVIDNDASNHFRSKVSLDALENGTGQDFDQAEVTGWGAERDDWTDIPVLQKISGLEVARFFAEYHRSLARMETSTQVAVANWMAGNPLRLTGMRLGITPQGVWRIIQQAKKKFPKLNETKIVLDAVLTKDMKLSLTKGDK